MNIPIVIHCTPDDGIWQALAAENMNRLGESLFSAEPSPSVIIASERYGDMWQAILAKCEELQHQPGGRPAMRTAGYLGTQGRSMSCVCHVGHDDGTESVYHIEAHAVTGRPDIQVSVGGPYLDSHDSFWTEQLSDRAGAVVIGRTHYRILPDRADRDRDLAGYGGALFRIRWLATGEVTETRNLWYQGVIPPKWRERMPDTAEFVKAEAAAEVTG